MASGGEKRNFLRFKMLKFDKTRECERNSMYNNQNAKETENVERDLRDGRYISFLL